MWWVILWSFHTHISFCFVRPTSSFSPFPLQKKTLFLLSCYIHPSIFLFSLPLSLGLLFSPSPFSIFMSCSLSLLSTYKKNILCLWVSLISLLWSHSFSCQCYNFILLYTWVKYHVYRHHNLFTHSPLDRLIAGMVTYLGYCE